MIRLIGAELARLRARRSFWVFALGALLLIAAFQTSTNSLLRPPTDDQILAQHASFEEAHRAWEEQCSSTDGNGDTTGDSGTTGGTTGGGTGNSCDGPEPQLSDFAYGSADFTDTTRSSIRIGVLLGGLLAFLIGASSIGAEYASGAIGNWLTYVPRRGRVFTAKASSVAVVAVLAGAVLAAVAVGGPALLAQHYGVAPTGWGSMVATAARGLVLVGMIGLLGFCAALLTRHTVAAVGIALGYAIVTSVSSGLLAFSRYAEAITPWTPQANFQAVLDHDYSYPVPVPGADPFGDGGGSRTAVVSFEHGLAYTLVLLVVVLAVSLLVFRRRDVG